MSRVEEDAKAKTVVYITQTAEDQMDKRSAKATAQLLILNAKLFESEKEKDVSRYRFTRQTLMKCANRKALRYGFLNQLDEEFAELGWRFIQLEIDFAIVDASKVNSWIKLSSKRLRENSFLKMSDEDIDDAFIQKIGEDSVLDDAEE